MNQSILGISGTPIVISTGGKDCLAICIEDDSGKLQCIKFFRKVLMSFVRDNVKYGDVVCVDCSKREGDITYIGNDIKVIKKEKILETYNGEIVNAKGVICCESDSCDSV
jgi:hypothetical protein